MKADPVLDEHQRWLANRAKNKSDREQSELAAEARLRPVDRAILETAESQAHQEDLASMARAKMKGQVSSKRSAAERHKAEKETRQAEEDERIEAARLKKHTKVKVFTA